MTQRPIGKLLIARIKEGRVAKAAESFDVTLVLADGVMSYRGTSGSDSFSFGSRPGIYHVKTLGGDDTIMFGGNFVANDSIDGGKDYDYLKLDGDYSHGLTFNDRTMINIEGLLLMENYDYNLTLADGNVATGQSLGLVVYGSGHLHFNGSAEVGGDFQIEGGDANDVVIGGGGNDYFTFTGGRDSFDGSGGSNTIDLSYASAGVTLDLRLQGDIQKIGHDSIILNHVENIIDSDYSDQIVGDSGSNMIFTSGGSDDISSLGGDDLVFFRSAPSIAADSAHFDGGRGEDLLATAEDYDPPSVTIDLSSSSAQNTGNGYITAIGFEDTQGWLNDDTLIGSDADNRLYGAGGNDTLSGGRGADILYGDGYIDPYDASFHAAAPVLAEARSGGSDHLDGGAGNDVLFGAGGRDTLVGGTGADTLSGGDGNDVFIFTGISDSTTAAPDLIADFAAGDRINLAGIDADKGMAGDQAFHLGQTAGHVGDIILSYDQASNQTTITLFVDSDATPDGAILLSGNHTDLTTTEFVL